MDDEDSRFSELLIQLRSNDVDIKIEALGKLQAEFESGATASDSDSIISALKTCLRTPNLHLVAATLSALPPALTALLNLSSNHTPHLPSPSTSTSSQSPAVLDVGQLRHALTSFLPSGGLFERLGDKDRIQVKARESLVLLGGYAFRAGGGSFMASKSGKGPETPLVILERFLRESGFGSKNWKVREQTILILVHIRRAHHTFPLRPYLPLLVEALEDTDAHVRDTARASVIELFTGPAVTDAARADLKNQMVKKGTRKAILDAILPKIIGGGGSSSGPASREGSENGDAPSSRPKEYIPPSMALKGQKPAGIPRTASTSSARDIVTARPSSRAATSSPVPHTPITEADDVKPVYIASARDLENDFADMVKPFEGKETEHNWAVRDKSILRVRGMLKGDVHNRYQDMFVACLKDGFIQRSLKTLLSLRTTVTLNTCNLYNELCSALGTLMDPFCEMLFNNLLKMAGYTKKITAQQSQATATVLYTKTSGTPRVYLPALSQMLQDKNTQTRSYVVLHFKQYMEVHALSSKHQIENSGGVEIVEAMLKKSLVDPNPAVKESARICYWVFDSAWHDRALPIAESLDATARKQLERVCPNPNAIAALPLTTPKTTKKTSVAAAIAASRAKAKAIATAPPTLRHQATAASSTSPRRPSSTSPQRASRGSPVPRPSSPLRMSSPPPSNRSVSRPSVPAPRTSTGNIRGHSRSPSGGPMRPISPPSSDEHHSTHRSSPLASKTSMTARQAAALSSGPHSPTPGPRIARASSAVLNRMSLVIPSHSADDSSLLLATNIPLPDGSGESEFDELERSINLMSFSQTMDQIPLMEQQEEQQQQTWNAFVPKAASQGQSLSPQSVDSRLAPIGMNALSSDSVADVGSHIRPEVVEDVLRARAEQAESAAERLLELNESEDEVLHSLMGPSSYSSGYGQNGNGNGKAKLPVPVPMPKLQTNHPPATPANRTTAVMRQAALFQDSPAYNGRPSSLVDILQDRKHETGWWLKRKALLAKTAANANTETSSTDSLSALVADLETGNGDVQTLQALTLISVAHPIDSSLSLSSDYAPSSPSPFTERAKRPASPGHVNIWAANKTFDRLLTALLRFLIPAKDEETLEYGLILLFEMLDNQWAHVEGREAEIFTSLLQIRYCGKTNVLEATNTIRDSLSAKVEPIYGIATLHAALKTFQEQPAPTEADPESKPGTYAFGLMALGKFILRLPAEVAEEEIPRLKGILIGGLSEKTSLVIRESAAAAIIAAQIVLRDEVHLFTLLDGLPDDKKNLLTYLFDKHGARGALSGQNGMDKLEKEMRRLDTRTSTPRR